MRFLVDFKLAYGSRFLTLYPDYSVDGTRDRAMISHIFLEAKRYEDLDVPELILNYCLRISEDCNQPTSLVNIEFVLALNQRIRHECLNAMESIIHCIRNDLKTFLKDHFRRIPIRNNQRMSRRRPR
ncbi:hypothetical protein RF11_02500 [Thelohanellus kitauei]|uniref:Uncharacterized protein n=1 Tax=Thelohanellus kitauei TaxID=669202 RepID=A0A0C2M5M5_THEKT|nr:hypothetical protein RF11_02500 [Thelohanellus kitauei]